jgi:pteridine reductase
MPRMKSPMRGRTALVTGAAKRLGRAVALALAEHGVNVVLHYGTSRAEAETTAKGIRRKRVKVWTVAADLTDPEETHGLVARAEDLAGPLDFLVNNASTFTPSHLTDFTLDDLAANVQVNAVAPLLLARAFAAQKREGAIVNFLDSRIADYDREHAAYHLSKRMLHTLTKMMALEFAPHVRVNAVAPGLILPPPGQDESYLRKYRTTNPLQRIGSAEGVADAVLFLLRSEFVTGQVIYVDGGRHLRGNVYG